MDLTRAKAGAAVLAPFMERSMWWRVSCWSSKGFFSMRKRAEAKALLRLRVSPREERWERRELVRGLGGKAWWVVRALKDFHASSVLLLMRDLWRVVWRVESWEVERQVGAFGEASEMGCCLFLVRAKIEG